MQLQVQWGILRMGQRRKCGRSPRQASQVTLSNPTDSKEVLACDRPVPPYFGSDRPFHRRWPRTGTNGPPVGDSRQRLPFLDSFLDSESAMAPSAEEAASLVSASSEGYGSTVSF